MNKCRYYKENCRLRSINNVLIRFMNEKPPQRIWKDSQTLHSP